MIYEVEVEGRSVAVSVRAAPDGVSYDLERTEPLGAIGAFDAQVRFFDFGIGRKWVFEVSVSDPVVSAMMGAMARVA